MYCVSAGGVGAFTKVVLFGIKAVVKDGAGAVGGPKTGKAGGAGTKGAYETLEDPESAIMSVVAPVVSVVAALAGVLGARRAAAALTVALRLRPERVLATFTTAADPA